MNRRSGFGWFLAWAAAGTLLAFSVVDSPAFGLFALPFAVGATIAVRRRARFWPEGLGLGLGAGVLTLLIGTLNLDYNPCPSGPINLAPGQNSFECGGLDPLPWFIAGSLLVLLSVLGYAVLRGRVPAASTDAGTSPPPRRRAWPWALLGLWFFGAAVPGIRVRASLISHGPFPQTWGGSHDVSLLFGSGFGGFSQSGDRTFSTTQVAAINRAFAIRPAGALSLALLAVLAFIVIRLWTRRDELAIGSASVVFLLALAVSAWEVRSAVDDLRPVLGHHVSMSIEPMYLILVALSGLIALSCAVRTRRAGRSVASREHDSFAAAL